jgi:replicative DNA helicase
MNELLTSMRRPPANEHAEQALLGAILSNSKAYEKVAEFLQPHHFIDPIHARIYLSASRLINAGRKADPVTLRAEFENDGILEEVGGVPYLATLLGAMVGIINAGDYGRAIHDAWVRRELIDACSDTVNHCYAPGEDDAHSIMELLDGRLTRISEGAGELRPLTPAGEAVQAALQMSHEAGARESDLAGITTGYRSLDRMTGGFMPGQMYLLGARPAMGKTGLGLGIAARAASNGLKTLFWSGEMGASQLGTRLAAAYAGLEVAAVFRGKNWEMVDTPEGQKQVARRLLPGEWDRLVKAEREAYRIPLDFDDRAGLTVAALRARARRLKRAKGLDLIVVDYVALMRASPQGEKQKLYERMTELSRDLQMLAAELQVPLLVLAQLNRANESRENKMPQLSDLRDTGALEQDAYCVMFIHRPHYYLMQAGEPVRGGKETAEVFNDRADLYYAQVAATRGQALVSIAKNRNGPTGICRLRFDAETIWFRDDGEGEKSPAWGEYLLGGV